MGISAPIDFHQAKVTKLLDLMRRATANGTHRAVAEAIARDWEPRMAVDREGTISILIEAE
jgi:hypothetical protein